MEPRVSILRMPNRCRGFEAGGRIGPSLITLIQDATSAASTSLGSTHTSLTYALQLLHVTNIRGVADTILRNPHPPSSDPMPIFRDATNLDLPPPVLTPRAAPYLPRAHRRRPPPWVRLPPNSTLPRPPQTLEGNLRETEPAAPPVLEIRPARQGPQMRRSPPSLVSTALPAHPAGT